MHLENEWEAEREAEREAVRTQVALEEIIDCITRLLPDNGETQPWPGVHLYRASAPSPQVHGVYDPSICVIAQGKKEVLLGGEVYAYNPSYYLVNSVDLPVVSQIVEASSDHPYLCLRLVLDPALVGSVMVEAGLPAKGQANVKAIDAGRLDCDLLDAVMRLVGLLEAPQDARMLAPLVIREIVYRLLVGEQGERLRYIAVLDGSTHRIARAVNRLREDFDQPLRVEVMARDLGMSVSSFHHHFKAVTSMSPLQFQKHLRLQEARRLLIGEHLDAASVGYRVGYEDASQFNREYKRLFGAPPMRDVEHLRQAAKVGAEA